jgi:hypothetical protein
MCLCSKCCCGIEADYELDLRYLKDWLEYAEAIKQKYREGKMSVDDYLADLEQTLHIISGEIAKTGK